MLQRQLHAVRGALSLMALFLFVATTIIIFVRPDITSIDLSLLLPIPLLAPLGILPVGAPAFLVFLEILGTARILDAVHPHSTVYAAPQPTSSSSGDSAAEKVAGEHCSSTKKDKLPLLARYFLATTLARLSLKDLVRSIRIYYRSLFGTSESKSEFRGPKILRVPPASNYLLEKLGVATAFTLVDDELACEPHALPQQLLIPSGQGLKLLDMCPTYDDDSGDDESTAAHSSEDAYARKRSKSFDSAHSHDSSDSDTPAPQAPPRRARKKTNIFHLRRKRWPNPSQFASLNGEAEADHTGSDHALQGEQQVQFEDPNWWQHLPALKVREK